MVSSVHRSSGWDRAFSEMAMNEDDLFPDDGDIADHSFDEKEWEW